MSDLVLIDTSVWIDHFRSGNSILKDLLESDRVITHPYIIGELFCGNFSHRNETLSFFNDLPICGVLDHEEIMAFIENRRLFGKGLGYIDVHLVASAFLESVKLFTFDKKLKNVVQELRLGFSLN